MRFGSAVYCEELFASDHPIRRNRHGKQVLEHFLQRLIDAGVCKLLLRPDNQPSKHLSIF